jgi:hypothetical protein
MTTRRKKIEGSVNRTWAHAAHGTVCTALLVSLGLSATSWAAPHPHSAEIQRGVALARTCEVEIDSDLGDYESCIAHKLNTIAKAPKQRLGLHFQSWLMADLAARQSTTRAAQMRKEQHVAAVRLMQRFRIDLRELTRITGVPHKDAAIRWQQKID